MYTALPTTGTPHGMPPSSADLLPWLLSVLLLMCLTATLALLRRAWRQTSSLRRELVRSGNEVRMTAEQLQAAFQTIPEGLVLVDCDARLLLWNSHAAAWADTDTQPHNGADFRTVFPSLPVSPAQLTQAMARMTPLHLPNCTVTLKGETHRTDLHIHPVSLAGGNAAFIRYTSRDSLWRLEQYMSGTGETNALLGAALHTVHAATNGVATVLQNSQNIRRRLAEPLPDNAEAARASGCTMDSVRAYCDRRGILRMLETMRTAGDSMAAAVEKLAAALEHSGNPSVTTEKAEDSVRLARRAAGRAVSEFALVAPGGDAEITVLAPQHEVTPIPENMAHMIRQALISLLLWHLAQGHRARAARADSGGKPDQAPVPRADPPRLNISVATENGMLTLKIHNPLISAEGETGRLLFRLCPSPESGTDDVPPPHSMPEQGLELDLALAYGLVVLRGSGTMQVEPHIRTGIVHTLHNPIPQLQAG
ncbi:PAS domain-containing protein [Desulfovibrio psychrotolerans]|uniref:PAS fold-4 domain-containing protein n=1 Tax=Desulfovibrio psychrotolerans TaxID=415242 RepID=A0A7J0BU85_9BACT|nr:PAS domain-containing protein [Desulfovibrio psychrotolerans]GFM37263.1 hypothetical protein DSM19430T_19470 [Desulfovibrio psychrotolerans]